ncbi:MAG TPA: YqaA family protein [Flavobacteriales bacterium]|nr:DedA family protein [Flavobacteriales bacterium]MCB0789101.1 DedA family protein [Flavobacteriales bacterium]MCB0811264.1 DedA family protein [Flavobacteriales bacterium]MCB0812388.1 DedA family protein [Flavobacteriales bacterium]HOP42525.1 YqaA family protein [Flavobacteriales bacterium]
MELGPGWQEWGLAGLFLASFVAATLLPLGSEAVLAAMALAGWEPLGLFAAATLGNWAGGMSTYALGRWGSPERLAKRMPGEGPVLELWRRRAGRWGPWLALLCWAPVVGDLIALLLGLFRVSWRPVALLMGLGKAARYALVLWVVGPWA